MPSAWKRAIASSTAGPPSMPHKGWAQIAAPPPRRRRAAASARERVAARGRLEAGRVGLDVAEGGGPDRAAARVVDEVDRLLHRGEGAGAVRRAARDEVGDEEVREVREALLGDPLRVGG